MVKEADNRQMAVPRSLHQYAIFAVQFPQQFGQLNIGVSHLKVKGAPSLTKAAWRRSCFCLWKHQCLHSLRSLPQYKICNRKPSFSQCRFKLLRDAGNKPNLLNRTLQWGMGSSIACGHEKPKRQSATRLHPEVWERIKHASQACFTQQLYCSSIKTLVLEFSRSI